MGTHYDALGVEQGADAEKIRKAYRAKAREAHPDSGGSQESFALVKRAYDILKDPERRKSYDECGDDSEPRPFEANRVLAECMTAVLQAVVEAGQKIRNQDIIKQMKAALRGSVKTAKEREATLLGSIETLTDTIARIVEPAGGVLKPILESQLLGNRQSLADERGNIRNHDMALKYLAKCKFNFEKPVSQDCSECATATTIYTINF